MWPWKWLKFVDFFSLLFLFEQYCYDDWWKSNRSFINCNKELNLDRATDFSGQVIKGLFRYDVMCFWNFGQRFEIKGSWKLKLKKGDVLFWIDRKITKFQNWSYIMNYLLTFLAYTKRHLFLIVITYVILWQFLIFFIQQSIYMGHK